LTEYIEAIKSKEKNSSAKSSTRQTDLFQINSEFDKQRANTVKEEYEKQMAMMKKQHELSVRRLNNEIEKLYSEKQALLLELDNNKSQSNHKNSLAQMHQPSQMLYQEYKFNATDNFTLNNNQNHNLAQTNKTNHSNNSTSKLFFASIL
jgi:hypothetical protein